FGERRLFVWATLAFVITSLLCALRRAWACLVVSRALQGFGERRLFVWATLAFVITSLLCALRRAWACLVV
ncbi:hypothetical protein C7E12_23085, partial [Stenotrophomonas maltophilia]